MVTKRRGRPPKKAEEKRLERLDLRVSEEEKNAFKLAADSANQDLSAWIRIQLHRAAADELASGEDGTSDGDD